MDSIIHNYIKMLYSRLGYLPNNPYYLISDDEMFDAFLRDKGVFNDYFPCPSAALVAEYDALKACISDKIAASKSDGLALPDWIYSYMSLNVITFESAERDIAYLAELANVDMNDTLASFTEELALNCYDVSKKWLQKQPSKFADRVPTMFGEPHVIKSLRLTEANVLVDFGGK